MERKLQKLEMEVLKSLNVLAEKLDINLRESVVMPDVVLDVESHDKLKNDLERLKILLFDYYALKIKYGEFWWPLGDRLIYEEEELTTVFSRVKVLLEKIDIGDNQNLEVLTSLIDEQTDFGILNFIPLLGKGNRNLGKGIFKENHNFGIHYHFCKGDSIEKPKRTTLIFTNHFDSSQKHEGLYCGQHGSYIQMSGNEVNGKVKAALIEKNGDLIRKINPVDWMKKREKFQKFWSPHAE